MFREFRPKKRIANIVGNIGDKQATDNLNHFSDEVLLRKSVEPAALFPAIRRVYDGPDMFAASCSLVADMIIMVVLASTSRLNMQIIMTGRLACVIFSQPQPRLLADQ